MNSVAWLLLEFPSHMLLMRNDCFNLLYYQCSSLKIKVTAEMDSKILSDLQGRRCAAVLPRFAPVSTQRLVDVPVTGHM